MGALQNAYMYLLYNFTVCAKVFNGRMISWLITSNNYNLQIFEDEAIVVT